MHTKVLEAGMVVRVNYIWVYNAEGNTRGKQNSREYSSSNAIAPRVWVYSVVCVNNETFMQCMSVRMFSRKALPRFTACVSRARGLARIETHQKYPNHEVAVGSRRGMLVVSQQTRNEIPGDDSASAHLQTA